MPRKKKTEAEAAAIKPPKPKPASLLDALKFVKCAQSEVGLPYTRHAVLYDGWAYAFNGTLSAGSKIDEHAQLAPHTGKLIAALERCGDTLALTQLPEGLQVRSGRLKAVVPCLPLPDMPAIAPDPACVGIDDRVKAAIRAVAPLVSDSATHVALAAIRLASGVAAATDRRILIEYWHGFDLPTVLLPKLAAKELLRIEKSLKGFGVAANLSSITFHFDDDSWLKTQLYQDSFPAYDRLFDVQDDKQAPVPEGFFEGCKTLEPFVNEKKALFFSEQGLSTEPDFTGSTFELAGLPTGPAFDVEYLRMIESLAKTVSFTNEKLRFFGNNVRGLIAGARVERTEAAETYRNIE